MNDYKSLRAYWIDGFSMSPLRLQKVLNKLHYKAEPVFCTHLIKLNTHIVNCQTICCPTCHTGIIIKFQTANNFLKKS